MTSEIPGLPRAIESCIGFLRHHQSADGSWSDWDLSPGASDSWTTAYLGCQLVAVTAPWRERTVPCTRSAAGWLKSHELETGGWGYNPRVGADADSTALAIRLQSLEGAPIRAASWRRLREFQQPDGGFATYSADDGLGSWGASTADVSASAGYALLGANEKADAQTDDHADWDTDNHADGDTGSALARTVGYLMTQRRPDGLWNSFWWSSPLYATRAALALLVAVRGRLDLTRTRHTLLGVQARNAFDGALLLDCLELLTTGGPRCTTVASLAETLIATQLSDGSWTSVPVLRLTDRDCLRPWDRLQAGPLYADPQRLFTSATVVAALSRLWPESA
ncbi:MAG: hypothetical protein QOH56_145 [Pseudonocardiales bacterium]|nr:hypothetical protein [Pseudonocardiales bacterium]